MGPTRSIRRRINERGIFQVTREEGRTANILIEGGKYGDHVAITHSFTSQKYNLLFWLEIWAKFSSH